MALPTLVKNWDTNFNNNVAGDADLDAGGPSGACNSTRDRRQLLLAIKDAMIAAGTSNIGPSSGGATTAWVVEYSCGGSNGAALAAGTAGDNVDRWTINTDLPFNSSGNAHAWMVLSQAGMGGLEFLIDCQEGSTGDDGAEIQAYISPSAGFTGGTTTVRPTATDESRLADNSGQAGWSGAISAIARTWKWNVWREESGEALYVLYFLADVPIGFWVISKPQSPATSWSGVQYVAMFYANGQSDTNQATNYSDFYDVANLRTYRSDRAFLPTDTGYTGNITNLYITADTFGFGPFGQELTVANDVTGEYALGAMGIASTEPGFVGKWGSLFDLYWGQNTLGAPFDTYPSGGGKNWAQFRAIVFPWDGSTPVTT